MNLYANIVVFIDQEIIKPQKARKFKKEEMSPFHFSTKKGDI